MQISIVFLRRWGWGKVGVVFSVILENIHPSVTPVDQEPNIGLHQQHYTQGGSNNQGLLHGRCNRSRTSLHIVVCHSDGGDIIQQGQQDNIDGVDLLVVGIDQEREVQNNMDRR